MKNILKIQLLVTIITFCFACKPEAKQEVTQIPKVKELKHEAVKALKKKKKIAPLKKSLPNKFPGTSYIGWLRAIEEGENEDVYLELYFREDSISHNTYDYLEEQLDSVVHDSGELIRRRLPIDVASQFFALDGLEVITVFNHDNEELIELPLKRVEYLEPGIDSKYIAVYEMPENIMGTSWIAIGDFNQKMPLAKYEYTEDEEILTLVKDRFNISEDKNTISEGHLSVVTSIVTEESMVAFNKLDKAYIGYCFDSIELVVYEGDNEYIISIHALPIEHDGMPLILTESGQSETDFLWENLLQFDGDRYISIERQRIKL